MTKTCRTCTARETPLLVDELAEALKALFSCPYLPVYYGQQQRARVDAVEARVKAALARYKEEANAGTLCEE